MCSVSLGWESSSLLTSSDPVAPPAPAARQGQARKAPSLSCSKEKTRFSLPTTELTYVLGMLERGVGGEGEREGMGGGKLLISSGRVERTRKLWEEAVSML